MKAKKPLLVAVLILALLAVALIVPAVAVGKQEPLEFNKAVNWVSHGENSNGTFHDLIIEVPNPVPPPELIPIELWLQGGHSVLVKEMPDGTLVGHASFHVLIRPDKLHTTQTKTLLNYDPLTDPADPDRDIDVFQEGVDYDKPDGTTIMNAKVAEFVMDFGPDGYTKLVLVDGGEPKTCDYEETWVTEPDENGDLQWVLFGVNVPFGNIQIHMNE